MKDIIFTPPEVATRGVQAIEKMASLAGAAMHLGIPGIGGYFVPSMPGQLNLVLAQTHHYKTGMLRLISNNYAAQLEAQKREEIVAFVQVEESIEEAAYEMIATEDGNEQASDLARGVFLNWDNVLTAAGRVMGRHIFRIGESILSNPDDMPPLNITNIDNALSYIGSKLYDEPKKFAGIFVDYLQAIPFESERIKQDAALREKRLQIRDIVYRLRRMGRKYQCPIWLGVQARQELKYHLGAYMRIPGIYDGEESSSIAQRADRIISMWMPKNDFTIGQTITHNGVDYVVQENMLFVRVPKQKGGLPSGKAWCMTVDFETGTMKPDLRYHR